MDNLIPTPDVSVIIAAYNVQAYIERALRSAIDQQGVNVEIILVDDKSTDATVERAASIDDPRMKIIRQTVNSGPGAARNKAIAAASAPWIAILDGDDAFAPDRLRRCINRARETQADIVVDNIEIYREAEDVKYPMFSPDKFSRFAFLDLARFIRGNLLLIGGPSLGYLKPIFSAAFLRQYKLQYDTDIMIGEDYQLLAEALACGGRCVVEPTTGYLYTVRAGSISHRLALTDITRMQQADQTFLSRYRLEPAAAKAQKWREWSLREAYCFTKLVDALKQKDILATLKIVLKRPTAALHLWRPLWVRLKPMRRNAR